MRAFKEAYAEQIRKTLANPAPLIRCEATDPLYQASAEILTKITDHAERVKLQNKLAQLESELRP